MVQTAKFWDKTADRYAKAPVKNEAAYQKKLEITRSYLKPDMEVFEFACGTGTTAIAHSPFVKHIVAIDISSRMLEIAQEKADAENVRNISFKHSTIEEFPEAEQSYDVVMAHSILHLLDKPEAAMAKVYKLLKPGGVFVTSTFCLGDSNAIWRLLIPIARFFRVIPYVNLLKRRELETYFSNAGFEFDHKSEPNKKESVFIVARRPANEL